MHRASGPSRGKPALISILACSLGFHAITFERSTFTKMRNFKNEASVALAGLLHVVAENVVSDRHTDKVL